MPENTPRFAYLLTIQNHGGWDSNPPEADTVHCAGIPGLGEHDMQELNEYCSSIRLTDEFIGALTDYFGSVDRKVVICMVGDHAPSLINLLPDDAQNPLIKRQTPYFIWTNYETENPLPDNHNVDLCALLPYTLRLAGLPLNPFYENILRVSESVHGFTKLSVVTEAGAEPAYISTDGELLPISSDTEEGRLLRNYFDSEYQLLSRGELAAALSAPAGRQPLHAQEETGSRNYAE